MNDWIGRSTKPLRRFHGDNPAFVQYCHFLNDFENPRNFMRNEDPGEPEPLVHRAEQIENGT